MNYILLLIVMFFGLTANTQPTKIDTTILDSTKVDLFPASWCGYWEGDLEIIGPQGTIQTLPIAYDIQSTDEDSTYIWAIIYGEDIVAGRRDYRLIVKDRSKGHYLVDEQNSIMIDSYLINNELISWFEVEDNLLSTSLSMKNEQLHHKIIFTKKSNAVESGNTIVKNDTIPKVTSYPLYNIQSAILTKKNTLSK